MTKDPRITPTTQGIGDLLTMSTIQGINTRAAFEERILEQAVASHGLQGLTTRRYETPYGEDFAVYKYGELVALAPFAFRFQVRDTDGPPTRSDRPLADAPVPAHQKEYMLGVYSARGGPATPSERQILDEYHKVVDALRDAHEDARRLQQERDRANARVRVLENRINSIREIIR